MTPDRERFLTDMNLACPADAIEAMILGLRRAFAWDDFEINMASFGGTDYRDNTCYGCAATCTLMEAANMRFTPDSICTVSDRAARLHVNTDELDAFEISIDRFRKGLPSELFDFFESPMPNIQADWWLSTSTWARELPRVERYLEELKSRQQNEQPS